MKISDKELDDLFNQKLNGLEVEPDTAVWKNIAAKLDGKRKKKSIVPALRIAAGIIVILSAGLLFLQKNDRPVKNHNQQKVVKQQVEPVQPEINQPEKIVEQKDVLLLSAKNKEVKEARAAKRNNKIYTSKALTNPAPIETDYSSTQTIAQSHSQADEQKSVNPHPLIARIAVVPNASVSLKASIEEQSTAMPLVKPTVLADANNHKPTEAKRKGIRNIGDLVNLVMAKVDKRNDKLIEFSDSDDGDESNVTGINLGIISIKKEK